MNFRKFSVCNDLRKLSRGFTWLFGVERNMQITLSQENHTNHSRERKFQTKTNDHRLRFQGGQTATKLKYVLLPIMSNKEGREACVRALEYSKQAAKSTYQCHFMLYFVSASIDPSFDIMGSLGTLDWWFCQSRFLVLPFPSEVDENPLKSFPSI